MLKPVKIYAARDGLQAHALRNVLANKGVQTTVVGDAAIDLGGGNSVGPELWANDTDAKMALKLVAEWEREMASSSSMKTVRSFQFGLIAILANVTVVSAALSLARIIDGQQLLFPMSIAMIVGNLLYIARYRRKRQRFSDSDEVHS